MFKLKNNNNTKYCMDSLVEYLLTRDEKIFFYSRSVNSNFLTRKYFVAISRKFIEWKHWN